MQFKLLLAALLMCACGGAWAQSPTYGVGKTPTPEEIRAEDITISPDGKNLPPGQGTAKEGAVLYSQKCAMCHGENGWGGRAPMLIKPATPVKSSTPCLEPCIGPDEVMALHAPFATVLWDFINRGMPFMMEGSLKPDRSRAFNIFVTHGSPSGRSAGSLDANTSTPRIADVSQVFSDIAISSSTAAWLTNIRGAPISVMAER